MRVHYYLCVMACSLLCQPVFSQESSMDKTTPSVQLKNLLALPKIGLAPVKAPGKITRPAKPVARGFSIANNLAEGKLLCPLIELIPTLELEGERNSDLAVDLNWKTTNGFDNWGFDIERSLGDTMNFKKVNFVLAESGGNTEKYYLPDNNDYEEVSYYRLKLIQSDNRSIYSNIATVQGYGHFEFALYPNPATRKLKIDLTSKEEGVATISVFNAAGTMVFQQSPSLKQGYNLKEIDVTKFPGGIYIVKMILPDKQIRTASFLKTNY